MSNQANSYLLPNCKNNYTNETVYDLFMESHEDSDNCKNCPNLVYIDGLMSCRYMYDAGGQKTSTGLR